MIFLYILLAIVLIFVLLLSVKVRIETEYIDGFNAKLRWSFLNLSIYPLDEKISNLLSKFNKPKSEEETAEKTEEPEVKEENINKKKPNPFKTFYENQGFDGVKKLITDSADALGDMFGSFKRHFIIDDLYLWIVVSKNHDAAGTAIEYGNICQDVFPALGYICSTVKVKNYDVNIEPDFIGTLSSAQFVFNCSFRPIFYLNAAIAMAFKLLFKVVFKVLFNKPKDESNENNKDIQNIKGGATQ